MPPSRSNDIPAASTSARLSDHRKALALDDDIFVRISKVDIRSGSASNFFKHIMTVEHRDPIRRLFNCLATHGFNRELPTPATTLRSRHVLSVRRATEQRVQTQSIRIIASAQESAPHRIASPSMLTGHSAHVVSASASTRTLLRHHLPSHTHAPSPTAHKISQSSTGANSRILRSILRTRIIPKPQDEPPIGGPHPDR